LKFSDIVFENMEYNHSDHRPIAMEFEKEERRDSMGWLFYGLRPNG
jgi:hypothetical protein